MHVKKGDKVKIIAGGDKGKVSEIVEARVAHGRAAATRCNPFLSWRQRARREAPALRPAGGRGTRAVLQRVPARNAALCARR